MNQTDTRVLLDAPRDASERSQTNRAPQRQFNLGRYSSWALILATLLLSGSYMANRLTRGFYPRDDGLLAQSAERVLRGEMPHRDFDEVYSGGESYLNAAAFRLFGTRLVSMRYALYPFFLLWVACMFFIASRFVPPWIAAALTILAVAWGPPNYATPLPSWYNLFFATIGVSALFRHIESGRRSWLFLAGICGGISFLFKLSGLYYVAGVMLFLLFAGARNHGRPGRFPRWATTVLAVICVVGYEASVLSLLGKAFYPGSFLYFSLPILGAGLVVLWERLQPEHQADAVELVVKNLFWFGIGVAIPILLFLVPYIQSGAVADFFRGIFISPGKRLSYTVRTESLPRFLAGTIADAMVIGVLLGTARKKIGIVVGMLLVLAGAGLTIWASRNTAIYDALWVPVWNLLPLVVVAGFVLLLRERNKTTGEQRRKTFLLLAVTAACSLVQFPYSAPIYFCYVAPLLVLCIVATAKLVEVPTRPVLAGLACIGVLYACFAVTPRFLVNQGEPGFVKRGMQEVTVPRGSGLHLYSQENRRYAELVNVISQHARGKYIYATPDCPEVYFLSGFANPTRTLFDFLDEPTNRTQRILDNIRAHDVNLVVLELSSGFSEPIPPDLKQALQEEFPEHALVGHFEVRWKT